MKSYLIGFALVSLGLAACQADPEAIAIDCEEYNPGMRTEATQQRVTTQNERDVMRQRPDGDRIQDAMRAGWKAPAGTKILAGLSAPQDGRWVAPGHEPGRDSGEAICSSLFDGAHVCSGQEIIEADQKSEFAGVPGGTSIAFPRDKDFLFEGKKFEASRTASCDNYTYPTADQKWMPLALKPDTCEGAQAAHLKFDLGPEKVQSSDACRLDRAACPAIIPTGYECNVKRAIACCKG